MRIQFFTVPIHSADDVAAELNAFLSSHRVVSVDRQFVADGPNSCWAICVTWTEPDSRQSTAGRRSRIDYKEVLNEQQFAVYSRLRALRKEIAERDGVPPYALFNNEQLAKMVTDSIKTVEDLGDIAGVGPSRIDKYGAAFLEVLSTVPTDERAEQEATTDEAGKSLS